MASTFSRRVIAVAGGMLLFCSGVIYAQGAGSETALTGVISDTMCGAVHMAKDKSPADCIRMCVKSGEKYALLVDKKLYTLQGHEAEVDKYAAQKVTVKGALKGNVVTVASVTPAR